MVGISEGGGEWEGLMPEQENKIWGDFILRLGLISLLFLNCAYVYKDRVLAQHLKT